LRGRYLITKLERGEMKHSNQGAKGWLIKSVRRSSEGRLAENRKHEGVKGHNRKVRYNSKRFFRKGNMEEDMRLREDQEASQSITFEKRR